MSRLAALALALSVAACVTPLRMYRSNELSAARRACGLALGELVQDESEKRLLFFFRIQPTVEERSCVTRWARKNRLRTVIIEAANDPVS